MGKPPRFPGAARPAYRQSNTHARQCRHLASGARIERAATPVPILYARGPGLIPASGQSKLNPDSWASKGWQSSGAAPRVLSVSVHTAAHTFIPRLWLSRKQKDGRKNGAVREVPHCAPSLYAQDARDAP